MTPKVIATPLIQHFEDCKLFEYVCPAGFPSIGWGHRIQHGKYPHGISQAQADELFNEDLDRFYAGVIQVVTPKVNATDNELAALTSFAYNIGFGQWHPLVEGLATSTLLRLYNSSDRPGAAQQFQRWNHAGPNVLPGLTRRRSCERFLFDGGSIADLVKHNWLS